jgi:hypothetical protein
MSNAVYVKFENLPQPLKSSVISNYRDFVISHPKQSHYDFIDSVRVDRWYFCTYRVTADQKRFSLDFIGPAKSEVVSKGGKESEVWLKHISSGRIVGYHCTDPTHTNPRHTAATIKEMLSIQKINKCKGDLEPIIINEPGL